MEDALIVEPALVREKRGLSNWRDCRNFRLVRKLKEMRRGVPGYGFTTRSQVAQIPISILQMGEAVFPAKCSYELAGRSVGYLANPGTPMIALTLGHALGDALMTFDDIEAEIGLLMTRMQNQPADLHELHLQLMQKLNELRAFGMPLPNDLVELERQLEAKFAADREP